MTGQILQAILLGDYYALTAAGLSFMLQVMRVINLARGSLAIAFAYAVYALAFYSGINPFLGFVLILPLRFRTVFGAYAGGPQLLFAFEATIIGAQGRCWVCLLALWAGLCPDHCRDDPSAGVPSWQSPDVFRRFVYPSGPCSASIGTRMRHFLARA